MHTQAEPSQTPWTRGLQSWEAQQPWEAPPQGTKGPQFPGGSFSTEGLERQGDRMWLLFFNQAQGPSPDVAFSLEGWGLGLQRQPSLPPRGAGSKWFSLMTLCGQPVYTSPCGPESHTRPLCWPAYFAVSMGEGLSWPL